MPADREIYTISRASTFRTPEVAVDWRSRHFEMPLRETNHGQDESETPMPSRDRSPKVAAALALLMLHTGPARADSISAFCESRGNKVVEEPNQNGSKTTYCVLKDGTRMNAVAYFRNQHRTK